MQSKILIVVTALCMLVGMTSAHAGPRSPPIGSMPSIKEYVVGELQKSPTAMNMTCAFKGCAAQMFKAFLDPVFYENTLC